MLPPFGCCHDPDGGQAAHRRYQERKLRMLRFWRDGVERQLAAVSAAISTLEQQMQRDASPAQD